MMQMLIFFLLGLLVFPSKLPYYFVPALFIAIFLTFIARPITMAILLSPFKSPLNQQLIMSWAGLRGAASIVFAIVAVVSPNYADDSIFPSSSVSYFYLYYSKVLYCHLLQNI